MLYRVDWLLTQTDQCIQQYIGIHCLLIELYDGCRCLRCRDSHSCQVLLLWEKSTLNHSELHHQPQWRHFAFLVRSAEFCHCQHQPHTSPTAYRQRFPKADLIDPPLILRSRDQPRWSVNSRWFSVWSCPLNGQISSNSRDFRWYQWIIRNNSLWTWRWTQYCLIHWAMRGSDPSRRHVRSRYSHSTWRKEECT